MRRKTWRHDSAERERKSGLSDVRQRIRGLGEELAPAFNIVTGFNNPSGQEIRP